MNCNTCIVDSDITIPKKINILVILYYVLSLLILRINGVEESNWNLSIEDVAEIENRIQLQGNYTVKTIRTRHGELYDCVNFYKQPAFNHPLSKNHKFIPQNGPTLSQEKSRKISHSIKGIKIGLNGGGCPGGTVPIRRVTKEDLVRAKLAQANDGTLIVAQCSANKCEGLEYRYFSGVSADAVVYNPENITNDQYSAAVMKLHLGPDSIETGWRVDPKLYGDNKTHFYIHTDARDIHCFDTLCEGFVSTNQQIPVGAVFGKISEIGGPRYGIELTISADNRNGNWILRVGGNIEVGYWPGYLFQQNGGSEHVEWGGEVYSTKGMPTPGIGTGLNVLEDTKHDAYFRFVKVQNGESDGVDKFVDPVNLICKSTSHNYDAKKEGNVGPGLEYLIFYGGEPSQYG